MAQTSVLKRRAAGLGWSPLIEGTDQALIPEIEGTTVTRNLWTDNAAQTINVGSGTGLNTGNLFTGANVSAVQIGVSGTTVTIPGNLTIDGTTTTVNTTNLVVSDNLILLNDGNNGANSGVAIERGVTGDDALLFWNEGSDRYEVGLFDTAGGTTAPAGALTNLVDLRADDLSLGGDGTWAEVIADDGLRLASQNGIAIHFSVGGIDRWRIDPSNFAFAPVASTTQDIGINQASRKIQDIWMNRNIEIGVQNGTSRIRGFAGNGAVLGTDLIVEGGAGGTTADGRFARLTGGDAGSDVSSSGGFAQVLGGNSSVAAQPAGNVEISGGLASGGGGALGGSLTLQGRVIRVNTIAGAAVTQRWTFTDAGHLQTVTGQTLDIGEATQVNSPRTIYAATSTVVGTSVTTTTNGITHSNTSAFLVTKTGSGDLVIDGGANTNNGVIVRAGSLPGGAAGTGGVLLLQAGNAGGLGGNGGSTQVLGGGGKGAAFAGGEALVQGGQSDSVAGSSPGRVRVIGGSAIAGSGTNGGNVEIDGGSSAGANQGNVLVATGTSQAEVTLGNLTNSGRLRLYSGTSIVEVSSPSAVSNAISLQATGGGVDIDGALSSSWQVNGSNQQLVLQAIGGGANQTVRLTSDGTGAAAIDVNANAGGVDIDSSGAFDVNSSGAGISLDGVTASNFTVTGSGQSLTLEAAGGGTQEVNIISAGTSLTAIDIDATAGGIDVDAVSAIVISSSAGSVQLFSSAAAGNAIDIAASAGGFSIDGALASNVSVAGAGIDLTVDSAAGRVVIDGGEAAADAVRIIASNAAGGIDVDCGSGGYRLDSVGDLYTWSENDMYIAAARDSGGSHGGATSQIRIESGPNDSSASRIWVNSRSPSTFYDGADISITGGDGLGDGITPRTAGEVLIVGGGPGGSECQGGGIRLICGNSTRTTGGADVLLQSGDNGAGPAGDIVLIAGKGPFLNGQGGAISIRAGGANSPFPNGTTQIGGPITVKGGDGGSTAGNGGNLVLDGGASPAATGGTVTIGGTDASVVTLGRSGIRVSFPTGTIVEGMARIKNGTAVVASDTADPGERMIYDPTGTGGAIILSAPSAPTIGDRWGVKNRSADTTNVTISGNGANIENPTASFALAASFSLSGDGIAVEWEYDGTQWLVV